ncbi:MAG: methyltransferase, TIGR04325 family [Variovorax sp.]|nr:methyltransferase, TIGR04325 family [Variovorax sp.]
MNNATTTQRVREFLEGPLTRPALRKWRLRQFLSREGFTAYFGVFDSFADARRWLPESPGFGKEELAREFVDVRCRRLYEYDYPVLWWLASALRSGARRVLDIGGSVGVHYYAYSRYLEMPPDLRWQIVEVPMIVSLGQGLAAEKGASALDFSTDLRASLADTDADLWLSAGTLQYMEDARPGDLLGRCAARPAHILLNKLPLYEGEDFVTAQNIGYDCFAPVQVFNRDRLIGEVEARGYVLRDTWAVHERSLYLPGFPERSLPSFSGLYFTARTKMPDRSHAAEAKEPQ